MAYYASDPGGRERRAQIDQFLPANPAGHAASSTPSPLSGGDGFYLCVLKQSDFRYTTLAQLPDGYRD
jgi:hypothetical protein